VVGVKGVLVAVGEGGWLVVVVGSGWVVCGGVKMDGMRGEKNKKGTHRRESVLRDDGAQIVVVTGVWCHWCLLYAVWQMLTQKPPTATTPPHCLPSDNNRPIDAPTTCRRLHP
jgi:hypothetical protein